MPSEIVAKGFLEQEKNVLINNIRKRNSSFLTNKECNFMNYSKASKIHLEFPSQSISHKSFFFSICLSLKMNFHRLKSTKINKHKKSSFHAIHTPQSSFISSTWKMNREAIGSNVRSLPHYQPVAH